MNHPSSITVKLTVPSTTLLAVENAYRTVGVAPGFTMLDGSTIKFDLTTTIPLKDAVTLSRLSIIADIYPMYYLRAVMRDDVEAVKELNSKIPHSLVHIRPKFLRRVLFKTGKLGNYFAMSMWKLRVLSDAMYYARSNGKPPMSIPLPIHIFKEVATETSSLKNHKHLEEEFRKSLCPENKECAWFKIPDASRGPGVEDRYITYFLNDDGFTKSTAFDAARYKTTVVVNTDAT